MLICDKKKKVTLVAGHVYKSTTGEILGPSDLHFCVSHAGSPSNDIFSLVSMSTGVPWSFGSGFGEAVDAGELYGWVDVTDEFCLKRV